ncbi:GreA/GreB family elongation factor [Sulfurifustis variabilis]|uniref:GreA/GreB family elongation factor n=1 Tax=Sulfurifustis variabilis TaxID=1675686 RepID=A0A1B4VBW8_9GAMM|nr:nucleoside diphosphate kinase regulator [Sulfurifustis variabilis]BAU50194.1 GreA/GreB family elongation factor [Sulfurifustis variabilis]
METVAHEIYVSGLDLARLQQLIVNARRDSDMDADYLDRLEAKLERAERVETRAVPPDIVTMNSKVELRDEEVGSVHAYTLVFPENADPANDRISVLAPLGAALLGARVHERIVWRVPTGEKQMRVEKILYQPEAAGDYHL